jgi:hypothetical protein
MQLGFAHRIGDGVRRRINIGDLLNRFNRFPEYSLGVHLASQPYRSKRLSAAFFLHLSHPFEIMNPMKTPFTLLVLLMLSGLMPVFGQSMPKPATDPGGAILDEKAHVAAKTKWIKENPEAYRKAGGDPSVVLDANKASETVVRNDNAVILPPFAVTQSFKVTAAEVVAVPGRKPSAELLARESDGLKSDMLDQGLELQIGRSDQIRLFIANRLDLRATQARSGNLLTWVIRDAQCATCSKELRLMVEQESATKLVYLLESEDADAAFAYRLTFTSIH